MQQAPTSSTATPTNVAAALISGSITLAAVFVLGRASEDAAQHAALVMGAMSISVLVLWFGLRDERALRTWAIGGIVVTLGLGLLVGGLLSRPTTVNEQVVMAGPVAMEASGDAMMAGGEDGAMMAKDEPAAMAKDEPAAMAKDEAPAVMAKDEAPAENVLVSSGSFEPLEHAGRGTASIIRTTEGEHVLTLTDFETDAGPDLVVMLVAGDPANDTDVENGRTVRLGKLKGTSGDQQYVLPADVDPAEFTHAYVWCRAFSVGFTRAKLA
jgi:hypothetical protein